MNILVYNCGSSSLTFKVFQINGSGHIAVIVSGKAHRVGVTGSEPSFIESRCKGTVQKKVVAIDSHRKAADLIWQHLKEDEVQIDYIGHRFVHGGNYFQTSIFLDEKTEKKLQLCLPLAPVHNPVAFSVMAQCKSVFPHVQQYVTFDSAFHASIPAYAYTYALPQEIIQRFGFRKYGFHGLSYLYVVAEVAHFFHTAPEALKIVACHLGTGGASVCAIEDGHSIDTSMGYSPLPGLIMGTRCGDIDPMVAIYLMTVYGYQPDELFNMLNKQSGLLGISGFSSDIRDIISSISEEGHPSECAFAMYIHRLKKYIGSYIMALGGIDVLVFTDDIGVHNSFVREKACENMEWCGLGLDTNLNRQTGDDAVYSISAADSKVHVLSMPTEEELVICREGLKLIGAENDHNF